MNSRAHWIIGPLSVAACAVFGLSVRKPPQSQDQVAVAVPSTQKRELPPADMMAHRREPEVVATASPVGFHDEASLDRYPVHPREPAEWQGRLQELINEPCNDDGYCGRGRACGADRTCGPCDSDTDCLKGEVCVLDHCLLQANVQCRGRRDCSDGRLCVLENGSEIGPRGNEGVWSVCDDSDKHKHLLALGVASEVPAPHAQEREQLGPPVDVEMLFSYLQSGQAEHKE